MLLAPCPLPTARSAPPLPARGRVRFAFSLVEILVVIGIITALIGGPVFIYIVRRQRVREL